MQESVIKGPRVVNARRSFALHREFFFDNFSLAIMPSRMIFNCLSALILSFSTAPLLRELWTRKMSFFTRYYWANRLSDGLEIALSEKPVQFWTKLRSWAFPKTIPNDIFRGLMRCHPARSAWNARRAPKSSERGVARRQFPLSAPSTCTNLEILSLLSHYRKRPRP